MRNAHVVLSLILLVACSQDRDLPIAAVDCRTGLYQTADGEALSVTPLSAGGYRWRMLDGSTGTIGPDGGESTLGWTGEPDGLFATLAACGDDAISLGPIAAPQRYDRVALSVTDTVFEHDGVDLFGRLIWPVDAERATLVVHTHGSEATSAVRRDPMPYLLAAQGIASFVYDKRGTGQSEGKYTQDFFVLAADARAALSEARRLAGDSIDRAGFLGGSQGGWVAPLAASEADVDFVVALYGMAVNALAEDRNEVIAGLARAGWGPEEQAKGAELADAAGVIMASRFRSGYQEFDRLRKLYRDEPWYGDVQGEFTGQLLGPPAIGLRLIGPMRDVGTSWDYEPVPVLRALEPRQLWMIAEDDREAPAADTIRRLRDLQREGRPIDVAVYPDADHGMIRTERNADGSLREPGYVQDYYRQIAAWIETRDLSFAEAAGAEVTTPAVERQ